MHKRLVYRHHTHSLQWIKLTVQHDTCPCSSYLAANTDTACAKEQGHTACRQVAPLTAQPSRTSCSYPFANLLAEIKVLSCKVQEHYLCSRTRSPRPSSCITPLAKTPACHISTTYSPHLQPCTNSLLVFWGRTTKEQIYRYLHRKTMSEKKGNKALHLMPC